MILKGKVHKYGANVNTDEIIPARYLNSSDPEVLAKHCMEDIDKNFINKISKGDFVVAADNFGCGSSREHAPLALKACAISAVIANSFARIFHRNAINIGLPILESPQAVKALQNGDEIEVDLAEGTIKNIATGEVYIAQKFPEFMQNIIKAGGLLEYIRGDKKNVKKV
ncbi:MAG: 3-isopropylmalate dehydratase small subunit [Elusimicrobiota bacterium]|nr:3-isopropylmalate dehydratase small subunit [Elusimicrobiota bacterium]